MDIIHLDMDAFYASVESLDDPSLRGKPVIVGGAERRGVVCAASYEARKFGVHSAQPTATARRLCPDGVFLPVRMDRYKEVSEIVFGIFRSFTPLVEQISIDEAFLDVTGSRGLFGSPAEIAGRIKEEVRRETGLTVSAGVGPSKLIAKIASDLEKPDGLTVVPAANVRKFLDPLPVGKLWGVGKVTREALRKMGVETIGDLSRVSPERLKRRFGAHGLHLHLLSRGIDDRVVEPEVDAKSIGHEDTYGEDILDVETLHRELLGLASRVSARLRRHEVKGRTITLKVKYRDFTLITRAVTLSKATDDGTTIYRNAVALLGKTEAGKRPIRLLGISLSGLVGSEDEGPGGEMEQMPLFARRGPGAVSGSLSALPDDSGKREKLNRAIDEIHRKFGERGVVPGTLADKE